MNNQASRLAAVNPFGATVVRKFNQDRGECVGWVSTWLRKRSVDKDMFGNAKYFSVVPIKKMTVYVAEDHAERKVTARQALFPRDHDAEVQYVQLGSKGQKRGLVFEGKRGPRGLSTSAADTCDGLLDERMYLGVNKQLASIGLTTKIAHALGVDCSRGDCVYFDPCLGEFTFPNAKQLGLWWKHCFDDRANDPGYESAWDQIFDGPFRMDVYRRLAVIP